MSRVPWWVWVLLVIGIIWVVGGSLQWIADS